MLIMQLLPSMNVRTVVGDAVGVAAALDDEEQTLSSAVAVADDNLSAIRP